MEEDYSRTPTGKIQTLARKSWTAYIKLTLLTLLALLLVPSIWHSSWKWGTGFLAVVLLISGYRFALLRSYHLYCDADGVWIYSGVLPWARGIAGVKWRDVDEALMIQTLWSWLFKSYTIRIGHRFTKANEIVLTHMAGGDRAVGSLNDTHRRLIREGALT